MQASMNHQNCESSYLYNSAVSFLFLLFLKVTSSLFQVLLGFKLVLTFLWIGEYILTFKLVLRVVSLPFKAQASQIADLA